LAKVFCGGGDKFTSKMRRSKTKKKKPEEILINQIFTLVG
jgi:hypothetical protein